MPPPGHACTHAQTDGHVEHVVSPAAHRIGIGGGCIKMTRTLQAE